MPSLDVKYTADLDLDLQDIFKTFEDKIKAADAGTGACKARGYKAEDFQYSHVYIELALLTKELRDEAWTLKLEDELEAYLVSQIEKRNAGKQVAYGINITYATPFFRYGKVGG